MCTKISPYFLEFMLFFCHWSEWTGIIIFLCFTIRGGLFHRNIVPVTSSIEQNRKNTFLAPTGLATYVAYATLTIFSTFVKTSCTVTLMPTYKEEGSGRRGQKSNYTIIHWVQIKQSTIYQINHVPSLKPKVKGKKPKKGKKPDLLSLIEPWTYKNITIFSGLWKAL